MKEIIFFPHQLGQNFNLWHRGAFHAFLTWSTQFHHGLFGWVLEPDCLGLKCSPFLTRQVIHHPVPQFLHPENGDSNSTYLIGLWWEFIVLVHMKCLPSEGQVSMIIVMMTTMVMALTLTSCLCLFAYPVLHSSSTCHFTPMFLKSSQKPLLKFAFEPMSSVFSPQTQWIKVQSVSKIHSGGMIHIAFSNHSPPPKHS